MRIVALTVSLAAGCALLLSACMYSMTGTTEYFRRTDLERTVEYILGERDNAAVFVADCPDALPVRLDAQALCVVRAGDGTVIEVTVIVTEAAGSRGRIAVVPVEDRSGR